METNKNQQASPVDEVSDNKPTKDTRDYIREYLQKNLEIAQRIADLYLVKFPRELSYGVNLISSEDASKLTICHRLSVAEINILKKCSRIAHRDECYLQEILDSEGYSDLSVKLGGHDTPMLLDTIESIDLRHPLKFTNFSYQPLKEDGTLGYKENIGVPLTDKEFKEILVELLLKGNRYSMNMLVYRKPKLGQKIIKHLTFARMDFQFEDWNPSVIDMLELKDISYQILNPSRDVLQLFKSNDKDLADFAFRHEIKSL